MPALWRKLLRDLWRLKGQVLAITLVIAGGVATAIMSAGTLSSLQATREAYYQSHRFAHVFATVERAPQQLAARIAAISGVARVDTRIVNFVTLDVRGIEEPVRGLVVSVPERREPNLNRLVVRHGRAVQAGAPDEVIVHAAFAEAHALAPGDAVHANINGKKRRLTIVGIALSPEFIHTLGPGDLVPDYRRYGVLWMGHEALAAAYDLTGAFNDVALQVTRGTSVAGVIDELDLLLARFGGTGAYGREDHLSDAFLESEFDQLRTMTTVMPPVFLVVAAFLVNIVIARLIETEREQIGLLKAFGYTDWAIGGHYLAFALVIAALGVLLGWTIGALMGRDMTENYGLYFRFPFLRFEHPPAVFAAVAAVGLTAAALGALTAVRRAMRLAPAVAMAPPPPTVYRRSLSDLLGLTRWMSPSARMVVRHVARWPVRSALTVTGIALALGLLVNSLFFLDAIDEMVDAFFFRLSHQDITVRFVDPRQESVAYDLARLPGVQRVELRRVVPTRISHGPRTKRVPIFAEAPAATLKSHYDAAGARVPLLGEGVVLSDHLARFLAVGPGDEVTVEFLAGRRAVRQVAVGQVVQEYLGMFARMDLAALNRLMLEGAVADSADLAIDPTHAAALFRALKDTPVVLSVSLKDAGLATFRAMLAQNIVGIIVFYVTLASLIAVGVVYNNGRIILSERARELASLRVLGYGQREVAAIVVGELLLLTLIALPIGCLFGFGLARLMVHLFSTDLYRMPFIVEASTYGYSMLAVLAAAGLTAAAVSRRVAALDLIAVLKTRE
jgi:putative ABC transport system permease protein